MKIFHDEKAHVVVFHLTDAKAIPRENSSSLVQHSDDGG
jgi:hypothetical protein